MVFFGEYQVSFTGQGRLVLPKKIRELLKGNVFVVTKGFGTCLAGYDKQDWETRASSLMGVSLLDKENIGKRRSLFASASYIEIDDQGRFVVPKSLLSQVTKTNKAVIIGVGDHFEIWDIEKWNEYTKQIEE
jgi:MraZ protein